MTDFNEDFEIPEDTAPTRSVPAQMATENAFYTANLSSEDPVSDSFTIAEDLQMNGTNLTYETALARWGEIQEFTNRQATVDIIQDSSIDIDTKATVVRNYKDGLFNSNNIKDQYVQEISSKDVPFTGEEDIPISMQDIVAQELFLDSVESNLQAADEIQQLKTSYAKNLNPDASAAVGGLTIEALSPVDLHAMRVAKLANDLGIQVTNEDLFKEGGTLNSFVRGSVGVLSDTAFAKGLVDIADFISTPLNSEILNIPRNFLFSGTLSKKIADLYDMSTPEGKMDILKTALASMEDIPGTDFQKWLAFQETIELGAQDPLAQAVGDVAGFVGASGAAAFFRNPVKGVKWYTTYTGSGLPSFTAGAKQPVFNGKVVNEADITDIPTMVDDVVRPEHTPTGTRNDNIVVSTVDVPSDAIKHQEDLFLSKAGEKFSTLKENTAEKIFDQSPELREKGNRVILLDASKLDTQVPVKVSDEAVTEARNLLEGRNETQLRIIANNLGMDVKDTPSKDILSVVANGMAERAARIENTSKFKQTDKNFVASENVEVKEVRVSKDGSISSLNSVDYNVMRANGMDVIPVSADLATVMNASKNGMLKGIHSEATIFDVASLTRVTRLSVDPNSPAGVMTRSNPVEAANKHLDAINDSSEMTAIHMGTTRGELIADDVLPKLDIALEETFPNVAKHLMKQDEEFRSIIKQPGAGLLDEAGAKQREIETTQYLKVVKEAGIGEYNQANSTVHIGRNKAEGIATYGRNNNYGWATREEAEVAANNIKELDTTADVRVVERNGSHWVEQQWSKNFNHIDQWMFGVHSMDSSFLGIPTGWLTRSRLGDWIFPNTMKGDPDLAKAGALAELRANKDETAFFSLIRKQILETPHRRELAKLMNETQESQRWFRPSELAVEFPHLKRNEVEDLAKAYYSYKRGADYSYELANKIHRDLLESQGFQGIYGDDGLLVGYGKQLDASDDIPEEIWDFTRNTFVPTPKELNGASVIKLNEAIRVGDRVYDHAILKGSHTLGKLPSRTLPKIEGWIPRRNKENWFIDFKPSSLMINGRKATEAELDEFVKTVGAGRTREEAEQFARQLEAEFSGGTLKVREAAENTGVASLDDYRLFKETTNNIKQRGERLRTIHGFSRLEDPLEAFSNTTRTLTRMKAWQPFKESFEKSFMKFADEFIPVINGTKTFPTDANLLRLKSGSGPEDIKRFKVAQRLFEQYKAMQYTQTFGDKVWRSTFNNIANVLEDVKFAGPHMSEMLREIGKQGNLTVRIPKALASHLFIYINVPKQWIIQPQQLLELNTISPTYASRSPTEIPAIIAAVVSRAPHMQSRKGFGKAAYEAAKKSSLMDGKEFDDTVEAIYNSGLPQAVDLNQMLYGTWQQSGFQIDPSAARSVVDFTSNLLASPGRLGKTVGYTPAEMANNIGAWLYSKDRWQNNNPGKNWNTPDNIDRITADSWDINHSMIGRAGAMPFQNGALGVMFQFMAVQQKGFMQLVSSKTLTPMEKVKLAGARMVLYGAYGLPMGAVGLIYLDRYVDENASEEAKQYYNEMKGGLTDALVNTSLDVWFADPDTKWEIVGDTFKGSLPGRSDIAMSKAMTPVPDGFPLYEMLVNLSGYTDNNKQNPRFPGPAALDSFTKAVTDIQSLWNAETIDSQEKLVLAARGLAETASLFNNYGKAVTMRQYNDLTTKFGTKYGSAVTEGEIFMQKIGIGTREQARLWEIINLDKERQQHISDISNDIFERYVKMERILGQQDYNVSVARLNEMLTLSVKKEDIPEVKKLVEERMASEFKKGTIKSDLYRSLFQMHRNINNEKHKEMMRFFRESATRNPGDARVVELWENSQLVEKE